MEGYWKDIGRKLEVNWKGITKGFSSKSSAPWSPWWLFASLKVVEDLMSVGHSEVFIVVIVDLDHRGVDASSKTLNLKIGSHESLKKNSTSLMVKSLSSVICPGPIPRFSFKAVMISSLPRSQQGVVVQI